jgi:hypothetical protein
MGQAFIIANLDKKQYLHPHDFKDGYKLLELHDSLTALSLLLANSGDHPWRDAPMLGAWAGDRIVVMGEYSNAYDEARNTFERVSAALHEYIEDA